MMLPKILRVGKQIQTRFINISLATVIGFSGLAGALPFFFFSGSAAASTPTAVYNSISSVLPANVVSLGFQATSTSEFGDYVHLAGTDRALRTVTVTMSDWALYSDYASDGRYSANNASWTHPLTLNIYSSHLGVNGAPDTLLATKTVASTIPWRPEANPGTDPGQCGVNSTKWYDAATQTCNNGIAFNVGFDFSNNSVMLPNDVIVGVAYNTQSYGTTPIGSAGPYNSLNVGIPTGQPVSVGSDDSTDSTFWNTSSAGFYTDGGAAGIGIFRQDTAWTPNGTVALQITTAPLDNVYVNSTYTNSSAGGHTFGYDAFSSISAALAAVSTGGTVNVAAGNYSSAGTITLNRAVNLIGTNATLSDISITTSNVTVDGFTFNKAGVQVNVDSQPSALTGLQIKNSHFSGYTDTALTTYNAGNILVQNNTFAAPTSNAEAIQIRASVVAGGCNGTQVLNNTFTAATTNGSADINFSCTDSASSNITVSGNTSNNASDPNGASLVAFSGVVDGISVTNNTATTAGSQVFFFGSMSGIANISNNVFSGGQSSAVAIFGGDAGTTDTPNSGTFNITSNNLSGNARGIRVTVSGMTSSGHVIAHNNNLSGNTTTGVANLSLGSVDATSNWWGSATGPTNSQITGSQITSDPYFTNSAMTIRSDAKVVPDGSGNATLNNSTPQVVVSSATQPLSITLASGVTNASIDFGALLSGNSVVTPQTSISSTNAGVSIPASTTITASGGTWDGVLNAPKVQTNTSVPITTPSGFTSTVGTVIDLGSDTVNLTFNAPVQITIPNQANKLVGFVRNGVFTQISETCSTGTPAITELTSNVSGACYQNSGADMVIWTSHFTQFVTYSQTANPSTPATAPSSSASSTKSTPQSSQSAAQDTSNSAVLGSNSTETAQNNSATPKVTSALAIQPAGHGKVLGLQWYLWLVGLAVLAGAAYGVYRFADTTERR